MIPPVRHVTGGLEHSEHYWLGRLSAALAVAPEYPKEARKVLDEFIRSPVSSQELCDLLKKETPK